MVQAVRERTVVIIGASVTGMLAAKSLAGSFDRVLVLERDPEPFGPEARKGIPQGHHSHVLLMRGLRVFDAIFPGLSADLASHGGIPLDYGKDCVLRLGGNALPRFCSGVETISCTRALLEWRVRERLKTEANVTISYGSRVLGYAKGTDGAIVGVLIADAGAPEGKRLFPTDLVIDAGGRMSRAPAWLAEIGITPPRETVVDSLVGYASRMYAWPGSFRPDWKAVGMAANFPTCKRGGAILKLEENRMLVTLVGIAGDFPPSDEEGFLRFAEGLPDPLIRRTMEGLVPIGPAKAYRETCNRIRHYEEMADFPGGLVVLGDAACALNPIYAQGLTLSAIGVELLARQVSATRNGRRFPASFCRRFQKSLSATHKLPWSLAVSEDIRWPETIGPQPKPWNSVGYAYTGKYITAMANNPGMTRIFLRVMHMVTHPIALFHPRAVLGIARSALRPKIPAPHAAKPARINPTAEAETMRRVP